MADEAVLDAPEILDTPVDPIEETPSEPVEAEPESPEKEQEEQLDPNAPDLWKKLDKEKLGPIYNAVKSKLIALGNIDKQLEPMGGVKGAVAVNTALAQLKSNPTETTQQTIENVTREVKYFHTLDQQFSNGDPAFVKELAETSPESFAAIAPTFADEWAAKAPEAHSAYIAKIAVADSDASGLPQVFDMLRFFVPRLADSPEKTEVIGLLNKLITQDEKLRTIAKNPVTPAKKEPKQEDLKTQQQQIEQQKEENTRVAWNNSVAGKSKGLFDAELSRIAGKTQLTPEEKSSIWNAVAEEWNIIRGKDQDYISSMASYVKANDKESYTRTMLTKLGKALPGAVRRAFDDNRGTKEGNKPQPKPVAVKNGAVRGLDGGMRRLPAYPTGKIDMKRTTFAMMNENKGYLKGEQHLSTWPAGK